MYLSVERLSLSEHTQARLALINDVAQHLSNIKSPGVSIYTFRDEFAGFDQLTVESKNDEIVAKLEFEDQKLRQSWTVEFFFYDDDRDRYHSGRIAKIGFESCGAWDETQAFLVNGPIPELLDIEVEMVRHLAQRLKEEDQCIRFQALLPTHAFEKT